MKNIIDYVCEDLSTGIKIANSECPIWLMVQLQTLADFFKLDTDTEIQFQADEYYFDFFINYASYKIVNAIVDNNRDDFEIQELAPFVSNVYHPEANLYLIEKIANLHLRDPSDQDSVR